MIDDVADQMSDLVLGGESDAEDVEDTNKSQNLIDQMDMCGAEAEAAEESDDAGEQDAVVSVDEAAIE